MQTIQAYHSDHLAEEKRCRDEIQLLEGPTFLPFPLPEPEVSAANNGFGAFLFETPTRGDEVVGVCALLPI